VFRHRGKDRDAPKLHQKIASFKTSLVKDESKALTLIEWSLLPVIR
jgi:hypothetical protein